MGDENGQIKKELEDILEEEVKYDSDGIARGQSPGRPSSATGSIGSSGSVGSSGSGSKGKRRSWKKPKDKPKRPLSAYNLFFKTERTRIVEGRAENPSPEEIVRSVERILSSSRETRRHRKTHGKISFGDLARQIAESWKNVGKEQKEVFERYAAVDMMRYRKEIKAWKERRQSLSGSSHSTKSNGDLEDENELSLDQLGTSNHSNHNSMGGSFNNNSFSNAWDPRYSMNDSFSSIGSSEFSMEPLPINDMLTSNGSGLPGLGMEVGVPNLGLLPTNNGFPQMENMNTLKLQPNDLRLYQQQQQLLNSMQFSQPQRVFPPNDQLQRASLEQQRQQLLILQQQQQLLQQQLALQQNNLRIQQGQLRQRQAMAAQGRMQPKNMSGDGGQGLLPDVTMSQKDVPEVTMSQTDAPELDLGDTDEMLKNMVHNLDILPMENT